MFTVYFKCLDERHSRTTNSSTNIKSEVTQSASLAYSYKITNSRSGKRTDIFVYQNENFLPRKIG